MMGQMTSKGRPEILQAGRGIREGIKNKRIGKEFYAKKRPAGEQKKDKKNPREDKG